MEEEDEEEEDDGGYSSSDDDEDEEEEELVVCTHPTHASHTHTLPTFVCDAHTLFCTFFY